MNKQTLKLVTDWFVQLVSLGSDQIGSDLNHDCKGSDQIRSIQSQSGSDDTGWRNWLVDFCDSEGINYHGKDLGGLARSVDWVRRNPDKIKYPRAYIQKIIDSAPQKTEEIVNKVYTSPKKIEEESTELTEIDGIPISKIDEAVAKINRDNLEYYCYHLPSFTDRLFRDRASVLSSQWKLRMIATYAIKKGVL